MDATAGAAELIKIISYSAPFVEEIFDPYLLENFLQRKKRIFNTKIIPLANKKIRTQDVGRKRQFDKLKEEFQRLYERKTIEEANYQAETKEKVKKRPHIPTTNGTIRFTRMESRN